MLNELTVSNFRNIKRLTVNPLARLTLIGGKNGVGKTALLEWLWRYAENNLTGAAFMGARQREDAGIVASRFETLQLSGQDSVIADFLRILEPRLTRFSPITINGVQIVHAYLKSTPPIPINLMGEGFGRLFEISVALGNQKGGMLLIDEIENGIHHSTMEKVFSALLKLAREFDVQIVATTHSRECIMAAHRALSGEGEDEFTYHRIDRRGDDLVAVNYDAEMRDTAEFHRMEIR